MVEKGMRAGACTAVCPAIMAALLAPAGCALILGLDEFTDAPSRSGGGGHVAGGSGGSGGAGTTGAGGAGGTGGPVTGDTIWARIYGDENGQTPAALAVDPDGNVIVAGYFVGTMQFGQQTLISAGDQDVFLTKLDPDGNAIWARQFGDAFAQTARGVAIDAAGNIFLTGYFQGAINLGGGFLTNEGTDNGFVAKFDPAGGLLWSSHLVGPGSIRPADVAVDAATGDVIVGGEFAGSIDFGNGSVTSSGAWDVDAFLVKLAGATGTSLWRRDYGDTSAQHLRAVAVDPAGNIVAGGFFRGEMTLGNITLTGSSGADTAFVARLDAAGNTSWARSFGSAGEARLVDVATDQAGSIILTGYAGGDIDLGCGTSVNPAGADAFLAKLTSVGNCSWSKTFPGDGDVFGMSVAIDKDDQVILTGYFDQTLYVDGDPLPGHLSYDMMLMKLTPDGALSWAAALGDSGTDVPASVAAMPGSSAIFLAALTDGVLDLGTEILTSAGAADVVVTKLAP